MVPFVTFLIILAVVYLIKFPTSSSLLIVKLQKETDQQNQKIGQLSMENCELRIRNNELEEKLKKCYVNKVETENEEVLNKKIEDLEQQLLRLKEEKQKRFIDTVIYWIESAFNSLMKQAVFSSWLYSNSVVIVKVLLTKSL